MIDDPKVEVRCDTCGSSVEIEPPLEYGGAMHTRAMYDFSTEAIERLLQDRERWTVIGGEHYCDEECTPTAALSSDAGAGRE